MKRKSFIQYTAAMAAAFASVRTKLYAATATCHTDGDVQGPFLREGAPDRHDLAKDYAGVGKKLEVRGTVLSEDCITPVSNALIQLWHAGPDGQYDQYSNKFVFRGYIHTGKRGEYFFKTLIPAGYKDGALDRPAHIHFIITEKSHKKLTTQVYFKDDPKLEGDIFVKQNNGMKRALPYPKDEQGVHQMWFDITLKKIVD